MVEPAKTLQGNTAQVPQEEAQRLTTHTAIATGYGANNPGAQAQWVFKRFQLLRFASDLLCMIR